MGHPAIIRRYLARLATAAAVAAPVLTGLTAAHAAAAPKWLTVDAAHHSVALTLIAGYTNDSSGFNFDGYSHGKMTVTVPVNTTVNVTFSNNAPLPHSAAIWVYSSKLTSATNYQPAFKGASTPNPTAGTPKGTVNKFSFTANKAGTYAIVCAVPGHLAAGMWDYLKVVAKGTAAVAFSK